MRTPLVYAFAVIMALSVAAEFILGAYHPEPGEWWTQIPAFYAIYGFVGCGLITVISKALGKGWLQRKEDYYD